MPQYTFTSTKLFIEGDVESIRQKENRTRSEMIDILLRQAVKERIRLKNKNAKKNNTQYQPGHMGSGDATG